MTVKYSTNSSVASRVKFCQTRGIKRHSSYCIIIRIIITQYYIVEAWLTHWLCCFARRFLDPQRCFRCFPYRPEVTRRIVDEEKRERCGRADNWQRPSRDEPSRSATNPLQRGGYDASGDVIRCACGLALSLLTCLHINIMNAGERETDDARARHDVDPDRCPLDYLLSV